MRLCLKKPQTTEKHISDKDFLFKVVQSAKDTGKMRC